MVPSTLYLLSGSNRKCQPHLFNITNSRITTPKFIPLGKPHGTSSLFCLLPLFLKSKLKSPSQLWQSPSKIPASCYSCSCCALLSQGSLVCVTNRIWQKWQYITSEIRLENRLWCLSYSRALLDHFLWGKIVLRSPVERPMWRGTEASY